VDEEERGGGDAGRRFDLGDDGADTVAEGGGLVKLRAEGLELRVHDEGGQPRRGLGVGGGGGAGRSGGAEAAQRGQEESGSAVGEESCGWGRERSGGGAEAESGGGGGGCCGCGSHCGVGFWRWF